MSKNCKPNVVVPDKYSVIIVQNIAERDDISCKLRQNGTIAIVVEEGYAQYQIQTQEGFYGVCDNNAWVQIETGDKVFDGNNLIILKDEEHKQEYLQSPLAVMGQMIFFVPEEKYYTYNGIGLDDPFPNKLDKPTQFTDNPDEHYIPVYDNKLRNPEWLSSNTLGKVESVNDIGVSPGTKNIELNLSDIPDDVGYATDAELTRLSIELDTRITQVEGINYTWNPTNRTLTLFDASGREMSQVSLVSLDNEGTDLRYNSTSKALELFNADDQLLDSIPVSDFVGNVGTALQLNSNVLQLKDSQGNIFSSVSFSISNISGLQTALNAKEPTLTAGTSAQYYRGDKTWQVLNKSAVGLSNVDNTSDINKPISTAQAAAIATKLDKTTTTVAAPDASFKYVYLTDETNNVRRMLAGDLGKNVANSFLTSVAGAGLTLGSSWTLNTNGQLYSITNLLDKSADASFNRMMVQNSTGQLSSVSNPYHILKSGLSAMSQQQALELAQLLNGGAGSEGSMSVNLISPPLVQNQYNVNEYILLKGANLNLNITRKIEILAANKTTVIAEIPNSQVQTYADGLTLIFYHNFYNMPEGQYFIRITSGTKVYITTLDLNVVRAIENIDLTALTWDILYKSGVTPDPTDIALGNSFTITTPNEITSTPILSAKSSEIFAQGDDFYMEVQLDIGFADFGPNSTNLNRSYLGIGYSNTVNALNNSSGVNTSWNTEDYWYIRKIYNNNIETNTNVIATPTSVFVTFIKTGNLFRTIIGNTNHSIILSNNSGYSVFFQPVGRSLKQTIQGRIVKAFKFN